MCEQLDPVDACVDVASTAQDHVHPPGVDDRRITFADSVQFGRRCRGLWHMRARTRTPRRPVNIGSKLGP